MTRHANEQNFIVAKFHAAAPLSPSLEPKAVCLGVYSCASCLRPRVGSTTSTSLTRYSRHCFLDIRNNTKHHNLDQEVTEKLRGLGKREGVRARLAASPHRPAIPSLIVANVHSLDNKSDYIQLLRSTQREVRDCCVFIFTESWLNDNIPDSAIQLTALTCYCTDQVIMEGGKTRSGGVISNAWCRNAAITHKHCSLLAEFMTMPAFLSTEGAHSNSAGCCLHPSHC